MKFKNFILITHKFSSTSNTITRKSIVITKFTRNIGG